ncbi:type II toxin-antitoxin system VapC family toxin [Candidatus Magnetomonas plexicatena]|uniref:type II toxin-antitoxin system VapC family toxin n=1 Tax=Candidatus Magnetomonas plexicatena TaxID=2552947 RepID=UPI0011041192|nr:PIN domain-containing protein [Nitrospirales bacterium LBB_01]
MTTVFVDTSALVAFFDKADEMHLEARSKMEIIKRKKLKLLLTNFIFDEALTLCVTRTNHETAVKMGEFIFSSNIIEIVWLNEELQRKAWEYFKRHSDKIYSFTDCTSFLVMQKMEMQLFFSFDEDFKRAGFMDFSR